MDNGLKITTSVEEWALSTKTGKTTKPVKFEDLKEEAQEQLLYVHKYALANCSLDDIAKALGVTLDDLAKYFLEHGQIDLVRFYDRACAEGLLNVEYTVYEKSVTKGSSQLITLFLSKRKPEVWGDEESSEGDTYVFIESCEQDL